MRILFCGDVVGRAGRDAVLKYVPQLKGELVLDAVIVNGDNAAGGFGLTPETCRDLLGVADLVCGGDHVFDQKDSAKLLASEKRLLRPHNFPPAVPGTGLAEFTTKSGKKLVVLHLLGQVFHKENAPCPFACAREALSPYKLGGNAAAILVDMHAEATSEKQAMGLFLDGQVSAVVGSHTHVPTADAKILDGGTAYLTDAGMCGDYRQTVIGFQKDAPMQAFLLKQRKLRMEPGSGEGTLCAVLMETDDATGKALAITPIRRGGVLQTT